MAAVIIKAVLLVPQHCTDALGQFGTLLTVLSSYLLLSRHLRESGESLHFAHKVAIQVNTLRATVEPPTGPLVLVVHACMRRRHPLAQSVAVLVHIHKPVVQVFLQSLKGILLQNPILLAVLQYGKEGYLREERFYMFVVVRRVGRYRAGNETVLALVLQEQLHAVLDILRRPAHVNLHDGLEILVPVVQHIVTIACEVRQPRGLVL